MSQKPQTEYTQLTSLSSRAHTLQGISSLLSWDQETYMPEMAAPVRAEQCEILAELSHDIKTSPKFEKTLNTVIDIETGTIKVNNLSESQKIAVRLYRRDFIRDKKLPTAFVQELALLTSQSVFIWQKAKKHNDFSLFAPNLEKIVSLIRKKTDLLGFDDNPYDALLEEYEPGCTTKEINFLFTKVRENLVPLLKKIKPQNDSNDLDISISEKQQLELCKKLLKCIGYDFHRGRIDFSVHPFSTSYHPYDSRITTRAESNSILVQILTTLHEAGHSFYDMGRPVEEQGTPLGDPISHGIHESQSRLWETRIGRSLPFWEFFYPVLQKKFAKILKNIPLVSFYQKINIVKPSLIRTDADELTYPLHVILRFEIEKELMTGQLAVKEIPERWKAGMKELLGIEPKTDAQGCLQDIHWSIGSFGYFPTYSLGNIYAAQMFETFSHNIPDWEAKVRSGQFQFIKDWLLENVWQYGRQYNGKELMEKITGKQLTPQPFIDYITSKYA